MKHKGFVVVNLLISLAILFALVGAVGGTGTVFRQSALAAQSRAVPEITSVEPASAPNDVDTTITISGNNFEETAVVYLGDTELVDVSFFDDTTLEAVVPWGWDPGVYDLTVENSPEEVAVLVNAFEVLQNVWTAGIIEGGSIDEIVINPKNPDTLYASSFGIGLFRSRDAGENWEFIFSNGMASNVAIDPVDPNYLYLFGPWQLFRSADAGDTWDTLDTDFPRHPDPPQDIPEFSCGADIKPYPHPEETKSGTVFASVCYCDNIGSGLIKSTDHGETWKASMKDIDDPYITSLAFHPENPDKMVVGTAFGHIYVSDHGGDSWEPLDDIPMNYISLMAFDPFEPFELWVLGDKLIKSKDSEFTEWEEVLPPADESWSDERNPSFHRLQFSPNDPESVYMIIMGTGYKTIDGGETWAEFGLDGLSFPLDFAESLDDGSGDVAVYMGDSYFGIYKSTDDGENWNQKNQGLTTAVPEDLSVSPADPSIVYGSMQSTPGIYRGSNYGAMWEFLLQPDLDIQTIEADPFTPDRVFGGGFTTICRSEDGGLNWDYCTNIDLPSSLETCPNIIEVIRAHPKTQDLLLAGLRHWCDDDWDYSPGSIYYTEDGGQNWTQADTEGMKVVQDLAFDPVDANVAYAGTNSGFYRSEDAGLSWVRMEGDPGDIVPGEMLSIAVEPARDADEAQHIVVLDGESGLIMFSSDQGSTWEEASFPSPGDNFGQFIFAPTDPPLLYAASRTGLRYSTDYGKTWSRAAGDLGYVNVIALETVKEEDRVILYAATPGGYAARSDLETVTTASLSTRDDTTLVNPGVYRFTRLPPKNIYLPIILY